MTLTATATIEVYDRKLTPATAPKLWKLRHDLSDALNDAADAVLARHGVTNEYVASVSVEDLEIDEENES